MRYIVATHEAILETPVARAMLEHVLDGAPVANHEILIVSGDIREIYDGISQRLVTSKSRALGLLQFSWNLLKELVCLEPGSTVYCRSYISCLVASIVRVAVRRYSIVFDTRGLFFDELVDLKIVPKMGFLPIFLLVEKFLLTYASRIVCVSHAQRQIYISRKKDIGSKCFVVPNVVDPAREVLDVRQEAKIKIGYVGSLSRWHCVDLMRAIVMALHTSGQLVELHVITKDISGAYKNFSEMDNVKIYERDFRRRPIRFDFCFCLIASSLSKYSCFPVKMAEYLASGNKIIYSGNVEAHNRYLSNDMNVYVDIDDSSVEDIAKRIQATWQAKRAEQSLLPEELHSGQSVYIKFFKSMLASM